MLLFLTACSPQKTSDHGHFKALIDLTDSTPLIRTLIAQNKVSGLLENHTPEELDLLLNNFSPAQMAFEAEVLSTTMPLVVVYYFEDNSEEREFILQLDQFAIEYKDTVKFVLVNADKLFSLAQDAEIELFPTAIISRKRDLLEKVTGSVTINSLRKKINMFLKSDCS